MKSIVFNNNSNTGKEFTPKLPLIYIVLATISLRGICRYHRRVEVLSNLIFLSFENLIENRKKVRDKVCIELGISRVQFNGYVKEFKEAGLMEEYGEGWVLCKELDSSFDQVVIKK